MTSESNNKYTISNLAWLALMAICISNVFFYTPGVILYLGMIVGALIMPFVMWAKLKRFTFLVIALYGGLVFILHQVGFPETELRSLAAGTMVIVGLGFYIRFVRHIKEYLYGIRSLMNDDISE